MDFKVVEARERLVAGHVVRTSNAAEADPDRARIPGLWRRAGQLGATVAVLMDYESDREGEFTQLVGREIDSVGEARVDELIAHVPAASYAMFATSGDAPGCVIEGWQRIWEQEDAGRLSRAYRTDLELWTTGEAPRIFVSIS